MAEAMVNGTSAFLGERYIDFSVLVVMLENLNLNSTSLYTVHMQCCKSAYFFSIQYTVQQNSAVNALFDAALMSTCPSISKLSMHVVSLVQI